MSPGSDRASLNRARWCVRQVAQVPKVSANQIHRGPGVLLFEVGDERMQSRILIFGRRRPPFGYLRVPIGEQNDSRQRGSYVTLNGPDDRNRWAADNMSPNYDE